MRKTVKIEKKFHAVKWSDGGYFFSLNSFDTQEEAEELNASLPEYHATVPTGTYALIIPKDGSKLEMVVN